VAQAATPHTLRHACAYELQGRVSPDVIMAQMRHRSTRSLDPYRGSALAFVDELLTAVSAAVQEMMARVGLGATTAEERRRRPAALRLQARALEYFAASRPAAALCGTAFAQHVGLSYHTIQGCVPNINAFKRAALRGRGVMPTYG
jgi:hypothetical protein